MIASRLYENLQKVRRERRAAGRAEAQEKGEPFHEEPPWRDNGASES